LRRLGLMIVFAFVLAACGGSGEPSALDEGRSVYGDICSVCHGARGQGGAGPALDGVLATWPSCTDHIDWIRLGSEGWNTEVGDTYGATAKPVAGGMPAQQGNLTDAQIAAVAAFERVRYASAEEAATLTECGVTG